MSNACGKCPWVSKDERDLASLTPDIKKANLGGASFQCHSRGGGTCHGAVEWRSRATSTPSMNIHQVAMGCKPDPAKFTVVKIWHVNGNTIVMANYGGATFNGDKLMVLRGIWKEFETLDPHFLNIDYPVIARFVPTEEGISLAHITAFAIQPSEDSTTKQPCALKG